MPISLPKIRNRSVKLDPAATYVCLTSFTSASAGFVREGDLVRGDAPAARAYPDRFLPASSSREQIFAAGQARRAAADARPELLPTPPTTSDGRPIRLPRPVSELPLERQRRCVTGLWVPISTDGSVRRVHVGDILADDDPFVRRFPKSFEKVHATEASKP